MASACGFHQRRSPSLGLVLQLGAVLEQQICHIGVPVLTGVGQGSISSASCGIHTSACLKQVSNQLKVTFLGSFHQGGGGSKFQVSAGLDQEVSHLQEAAAARQGQGRLLGLLCLSIDVGSLR